MRIDRLSAVKHGAVLKTDLAIVGGGPAGLTIAEQCARHGIAVLVIESGLEQQDHDHEALNEVQLGPCDRPAEWHGARTAFHAGLAELWSAERQGYGVRCRGLGGSTQAWAGKSACFDPIDYARRPWVEASGWPVSPAELQPFIRQAGDLLNLCPNEPSPRFAGTDLVSFYWQFSRSRVERLDVMRFGRELLARSPPGVDVLLDATVTRIALAPDGTRVASLDVANLAGRRARVEAAHFVLAASAIENARLLLASNDVAPAGIGNPYDNVGRYMIDHLGASLGAFEPQHVARMARLFGFYGVPHNGKSHMFMHGLALAPELQEREGLLNAAVYFAPQRAPDDPWDALKRLLKGRSSATARDIASVAKGSGTLVRGMGVKALSAPQFPGVMKELIVNSAIRLSPNMVAAEFSSGGLPHKLSGLSLEAVTEQEPQRDNRIALSPDRDRLGVPLPRADWRVGMKERRTLLALARRVGTGLASADLPTPRFASWIESKEPAAAGPIDLAHTMGTTRMSLHPRSGVVDRHCRVHGVANLHIAGGSVLPTGGHANPTWMILAVACRLAARLRDEYFQAEACSKPHRSSATAQLADPVVQ
ncbi:NAD(P)-binding protein [Altererythrobacter soli]|uniref:NAD(P)-binding protein n=1 Tax=Croceibacterium soli TaxID=1739690 RepID=A0A6I4UUD3_9SPHN|nr:GMC oxidoreductase [Croceibacterium soli]MXP41359.1 NAD(P)-binding protein [Croceibacterium soli]